MRDRVANYVGAGATCDLKADLTWTAPRSIVILYAATVAFSAAFCGYLGHEIEQPSSPPATMTIPLEAS